MDIIAAFLGVCMILLVMQALVEWTIDFVRWI